MKTTILTTLLMLFSVAGFAQVPTEAAPTPPARDAADVISLFSDAYTDITLNYSADFDDSDIADTTIAGDAVKKITFGNFIGWDFADNKQDASAMNKFHIDFWTATVPDGGVFNSKLVDFGGTDAEVSAIEFNVNAGTTPALVGGTWVSADFDIPSGASRADIAQFIITVSGTLDVVFVDNVYLYNDGGGSGGGGGGDETVLFADSLNAATATDDWIQAGDAAGRPSEVTFEYDAAAGVDGSGAVRMGGTNADGAGGRAYIFEKIFSGVDFQGETDVTVKVSIKSEALTGTNVSVLTDINGSIQENASITGDLSDSEYTTFTFNHPAIPEAANFVKFQFNVAAGAGVDLGGTILIDNLLVTVQADNGGGGGELVTNGDFEAGDDGSWYGNALDIRTEGGNSFNFADVATAGNPFDVNLSQNVDITPGETYTLTFQASTSPEDVSRTMVVGIGESQDPFRADVETVTITDTPETYTLELTATDDGGNGDFGDATSRIIFDMGADVGVVVIDDVSLRQGLATSNENEDELPSEYVLNQNYPNPFNPTTNISFTIPQAEQVSIKVYDMLGREVATLVNQQRFGAGSHQVVFNAANLSSGIYIYRLQAGTASFTKKMTLIK